MTQFSNAFSYPQTCYRSCKIKNAVFGNGVTHMMTLYSDLKQEAAAMMTNLPLNYNFTDFNTRIPMVQAAAAVKA